MTFCLLALLMKPFITLCKLMSCQLLKKKIQTMLGTLILVKYVLLNLTGWQCDVLLHRDLYATYIVEGLRR